MKQARFLIIFSTLLFGFHALYSAAVSSAQAQVDPSVFQEASAEETPTPTPVETTVTGQGVSGDMDSKKRNPVLSLTTVVAAGNVKILADAYIQHPDYQKYPMKFEFFVNRKLFVTQVRSTELPGAVGVDIGPDIAAPPFNYTVICTMLHPNREFKTIINGAVFEGGGSGGSTTAKSLECTLSSETEDGTTDFVATGVTPTQQGTDSYSITFDGTDSASSATASVSGTITVTGTTASSELQITKDGTASTVSTAGTVEAADGSVSSIDLSSEDAKTTLSCS